MRVFEDVYSGVRRPGDDRGDGVTNESGRIERCILSIGLCPILVRCSAGLASLHTAPPVIATRYSCCLMAVKGAIFGPGFKFR